MRPSLSTSSLALLHHAPAAPGHHAFARSDNTLDLGVASGRVEDSAAASPTDGQAATKLGDASPTSPTLVASPKTRGTEELMAAKKTPKKATPKKARSPNKSAKGNPKAKFGAKSEFIRSQPADMPAKQVVEAAKQAGLTLSENLVYATRADAKKKAVKGSSRSATPKRKPGRPRASSPKTNDLDAQLRSAIAEMGLARARQVFSEVEAAFAGR